MWIIFFFFFSSRRRHTRWPRDWSSDVCSSDLHGGRKQVLRKTALNRRGQARQKIPAMRGCLSAAWLRSFLQPVTYLGVGMSLVIVAGLFYLISKDKEAAYSAALQNGDNLARVFEGYIARTIKSADNTLLYLRKSYQRDPANFTLATLVQDPDPRHEMLFR